MSEIRIRKHLIPLSGEYAYDISVIDPLRSGMMITVGMTDPTDIEKCTFIDVGSILILRVPVTVEEIEIVDITAVNNRVLYKKDLCHALRGVRNNESAIIPTTDLLAPRVNMSELIGVMRRKEDIPYILPFFYLGDSMTKYIYINGTEHPLFRGNKEKEWLC